MEYEMTEKEGEDGGGDGNSVKNACGQEVMIGVKIQMIMTTRKTMMRAIIDGGPTICG